MATKAKAKTTKPKTVSDRGSGVSASKNVVDGPKKKKNYDTFKKFIQDLLKKQRGGGISGGALDVTDRYVKIILEMIIRNADLLLARSKKKTLSEKEIESAVRLTIPPPHRSEFSSEPGSEPPRNLAVEANKRGAEAVRKFMSAQNNKVKGQGRSTKSKKADLVFPVSRVKDRISESSSSDGLRVGEKSIVYLTAVLQYLTEELLQMAGEIADSKKHVRITPRDLKLAIENDASLVKLTENVYIPGGVRVRPKKR
uniref:Histone 2A-domain-containing protein n=1 Tax=Pithovirus LCPAC304 TaxID=2506594 RepID=A0A481Z7C9_9VIRU|nr:MAG: histone 2A-domain-containing protein [Pithovirus LCPAC304]